MNRLLIAFIFSLALISCGQDKKNNYNDKPRIDKVCDQFMQTFAEGKIDRALQLLKQNTTMTSSSIDTLQVTITNQISNIFPAYGMMLSSEFISERNVKDLIAKRFYILKFDKYYLKFAFTLYNNGKAWAITSFNYDDDMTELHY